MNGWVAALVGLVALGLAGYALSVARKIQADIDSTGEALRGAQQAARETGQKATEQQGHLLRRLAGAEALARQAMERVEGLEARVQQAETALHELQEVSAPPPIPSGRSVAKLDDLRATLRAQAEAEALEQMGPRRSKAED